MYQVSENSATVSAKFISAEEKEKFNELIQHIQEETGTVVTNFREALLLLVNNYDAVKPTDIDNVKEENTADKKADCLVLQPETFVNIEEYRVKNNLPDEMSDIDIIEKALTTEPVNAVTEKELSDNQVVLNLHQDEINLIVTINENRNNAIARFAAENLGNPEFTEEDFVPETIEDTIMESVFMEERVLHSEIFFTGIYDLSPYPIYND